ncbi:MAG: hypothetical protein RXS25_31210, partial [Paraburkholderia sp.]
KCHRIESHWPGMEPQSKIGQNRAQPGKTTHNPVSVALPAGKNPAAPGALPRDNVPFCGPLN